MLQIGVEVLVGVFGGGVIQLIFRLVRNPADVTYTSPFIRVLGLALAGVFSFGFGDAFEDR